MAEGRDSHSHLGTSSSTGEGTDWAKHQCQDLETLGAEGSMWALLLTLQASQAQEWGREGLAAFTESSSDLTLGTWWSGIVSVLFSPGPTIMRSTDGC